jgi:hypothetical protein
VGFSSQNGFGGCFVVDPVNGVRPYRDGLIANNFNGFGGDGIEDSFDRTIIIPIEDRAAININARFEFTPAVTGYVESKFAYTQSDNGTPLNTFFDLLFGAPDNPFIPTQLQGLAEQAGGCSSPATTPTSATTAIASSGVPLASWPGWRASSARV